MDWSRNRTARATQRAAAGFALSASLVVSALPASAAAGGHLYLGIGSSVERFPLQNGVPSTQPDLTIPGYGGALAVAPDGTVYALRFNGSGYNAFDIYAFTSGQTKPSREIILPRNGQCTLSSPPIQGLAVDGKGNLFVLVVYAQSGARPFQAVVRPDAFPICLGVAVFAANASGKAKPLQAIPLNDFYFGGMTVSNHDDLYVNLSDYAQTDDIANAARHPHQTRALPAQDNPSVATDKDDNAYLLTYGSGSLINVFAPSWTSGPPTRSISLSSPFNETISLAVRGKLAYLETLPTGSNGSVGVFDATGNGPENPLEVVTYSGIQGPMAVGP